MTYTPPGGAPTGRRDLDSLTPRERAEYFCRFFHLPLTPENLRAFERNPHKAPEPDPEPADPDELDLMVPPELRRKRSIFVFPGGALMPGPVTADAIQTLLGIAEMPNTVLTNRVASEYLREFLADPDSVMLTVETIRRALPALISVALERSLRAVERVP